MNKSDTITATNNSGGVLTDEQLDLVKRTICQGATDDEFQLFIGQCRRTRLDPFARQIYSIERNVKEGDKWVKKRSIQVSIDGFRLIADRTKGYEGQTAPVWCGKDGVWKDVWLEPEQPSAAKIGVHRAGFKEPCWAVATWESYVQKNGKGEITSMWAKMGDVMIAKCAEALALRKAFPQELSGLYTTDEMGQAENNSPQPPPAQQLAAGPVVKVLAGENTGVSTSILDWREVVCHVGRPGGEMHLKKLGDMNSHQIKWLNDEFLQTITRSPQGKDKALVDAVLHAVAEGAHISKSEASPEPTTPETKATPPTEPPKPVEVAKKRKATIPKTEEKAPATALEETQVIRRNDPGPMAWREVVVHVECAAKGKTIYEILATERGSMASHPKADGATWLANICKKLVPDLEKSAEVKDGILANAIKAAVEETGAMLNTEDLRTMLMGLFVDEDMFKSQTFTDPAESLSNADDDMLRWIARNQPSILAKATAAHGANVR